MSNYNLKHAILIINESLEYDEPFKMHWEIGEEIFFDVPEELQLEYYRMREVIKQKAAKEWLELHNNLLIKIEEIKK